MCSIVLMLPISSLLQLDLVVITRYEEDADRAREIEVQGYRDIKRRVFISS